MTLKKYYFYSDKLDKWRKVAQKWGNEEAPKITLQEGDAQREIVTARVNNGTMWETIEDGDNYADSFEYNGDTVYITNLFWRGDLHELETTSETLYFINEDARDEYIENNGLIACAYCGTYIDTERDYDYIYYERDGEYYCNEDCLNGNDLHFCYHCGETICNEDNEDVHGHYYCDDCFFDACGECYECGEYYPRDELNYDERNDVDYCDECYQAHARKIKTYHTSKKNNNYHYYRGKDNDNEGLYIGQELEIECNENDNEEIAERIDEIINEDNERCFFEYDGSLTNGVEIISQPATINAWRGEFMKLYRQALTMLSREGCTSHDSEECGLHFHLTRNYFTFDEIARLYYVVIKYQNELVKLSRRKKFRYCKLYDIENNVFHDEIFYNSREAIDSLTVERVKELINDGTLTETRYVALNLQNDYTLEYRLTRGTLNVDTFFASIELVYNLAQYIKSKSDADVENGSFQDVLTATPTTHLLQYAQSKGVA